MKLSESIEYYKRNGYAKIDAVFTKEECEQIRYEAYKSLNYSKANIQWRGSHPALLFWPNNSYLKRIANDIRLQEIVETYLGPHTFQLNNQIYFREPGDDDEFAWHQDICFRTPPEDFHNIEEGYLQTIIAIDPMTDDNGAIEFIPKSHKWGNQDIIPRDGSELGLRTFVRGEYHGVKLYAQPGDVLIWSVMTVHGSEKNISGHSRMSFMNGFASYDSVLNKKRFPIYGTNQR